MEKAVEDQELCPAFPLPSPGGRRSPGSWTGTACIAKWQVSSQLLIGMITR